MLKVRQIIKATFLIKLFTHVSAVVVLLLYSRIKDIPFLISLMLIVLFINYFRQFFLTAFNKPLKYKLMSTVAELLFIICIGLIEKNGLGLNLLFFFACISEAIIYYESRYAAVFLIIPYWASIYLTGILYGEFSTAAEIYATMLSSGVSIVFVAGTSYFVKSQIKEREKLARVNKELEEAYKNLIDASTASEQLSVEKERIRMAREIHDTLAHTLTTLIVQLEVCKKLSSVDAGRLAEELEKAQELTRSGLNDVKRTIKSLRPQALEGKSFFESVLDLINNTMNNTEVHIILNNNLPQEIKLPTSLDITIFRVIQESITNSIRHGHSREIQINMDLIAGMIVIDIRDDGAGCARIKRGFGLSGIQERIEASGGSADFSSTPGNGFETRVSIPLKEE